MDSFAFLALRWSLGPPGALKKSLKMPNQIGRFREIVSGSTTAYPLLIDIVRKGDSHERSGYAVS